MAESADALGTDNPDIDALVDTLAEAFEEYERRRERVEAIGEDDLKALANAHDRATALLDRYAGSATGSGDFEAFVSFQEAFSEHVESLPTDLPERAAFERANERFDKRRLSTGDFERARETLGEAGALAGRLSERREAYERYREARRAITTRRDEVDERLAELRRLERYGQADLDAPIDDLREPITVYNRAATEAFGTLRDGTSARTVLGLVAATRAFPLVPFARPPSDLEGYVETSDAGTEPIPDLIEYSGYSVSKLGHYVENPEELRRHVSVHRTYLVDLDATPLTIDWPPPPARELWWRARELTSVLARFDATDALARLRAVRAFAGERERYERLREAAQAIETLDEAARARVASGAVEGEITRLASERDRIEEVLATYSV
jgi:hypothetical protein